MTLKSILKGTLKIIFSSNEVKIKRKDIDNLTKQATFFIKKGREPKLDIKKTKDIIACDYFSELSEENRKLILEQYRTECRQPLAFIEEHPLHANKNNQYIFKILLLESRKMVTGTASYFIKNIEGKQILALLSEKDIVNISVAYYREQFEEINSKYLVRNPEINVHYLK